LPLSAQEWTEFASKESGFTVNFPGEPRVSQTTYKSEYGYTLPAQVYSAARGPERYSVTVDPDSTEGQFLDLVNLQSDEARKLSLIEQFTQRFPKHQAVSWAYEQLQLAAMRAGQWDRALTFGEKLVQLHPNDMDTAQLNIKAAESKGEATTVKLWTDFMMRIAQRVLESPPPKDP